METSPSAAVIASVGAHSIHEFGSSVRNAGIPGNGLAAIDRMTDVFDPFLVENY
ncbi:MAG: hypothetical protein ACREQ2_04690 [Candidatus Binatia bacterium]